jgi:hypothetical protein
MCAVNHEAERKVHVYRSSYTFVEKREDTYGVLAGKGERKK